MEHNASCERPSAETQLSEDICLLHTGSQHPTARQEEPGLPLALVAVTSLRSAARPTLFGQPAI